MMKRLFLVDISSLFFRAFYAIRPLTSPKGLPTNAVYGVLSMLTKLLKEENPDYIAICYDRKEPSFRKALYEEYKANRTEMPEELAPQIPVIKQLIDLLGLPSLEVPGFEADDIIGTLALAARKNDIEVFIVSGDKDFSQLIVDHMYLYDTMKNETLGPKQILEKWGVAPEKFLDYLALVGDTSDNIPGVKGIGPKGAQNLLAEFHTLDGIYAGLAKIKSESVRNKLETSKDNAYLSRKLATIVTDVPVSTDFADYIPQGPKISALQALLQELNFKSFEKSLIEGTLILGAGKSAKSALSTLASFDNSKISTSVSAVEQPQLQVEYVEASKLGSVFRPGEEVWFFSGERGVFLSNGKTVFELQGELKEIGHTAGTLGLRWRGHDLKTFWHQIGVSNPQPEWDSLLAAYSLRPGEDHSFEKVYSWMTGQVLPDLATSSDLIQAQILMSEKLRSELQRCEVENIYRDLELPLVVPLYEMENTGIRLDKDLLAIESKKLTQEIQELEKTIHGLAGSEFNIGSPKQLSQILFEKLKLTSYKKTKTGYSTDNEVLEKLLKEHEIIPHLLQYRELTKLKSTYVDALPLMVKEDGRIHSTFNQAMTATGRLSSIDPNLQNIPIKTKRGAQVRRAFVADSGKSLLSVDYSQIELRILAHFSEDPNMIRAFEQDLDIHTATASEVFNVKLQDVTPEMRRAAKAVNFGIAYGQGAFGLAENLGIARGEAQGIIQRYFERFSRVQNYIEDTIEKAKAQGYVKTLEGRRRYIDELKSSNGMLRKFGERAAINAPIQGSASDIVKRAMIELSKTMVGSPLKMLLQVHDELIFEGPQEEVRAEAPRIVKVMESICKLKVPLKANSAIGPNWDEAH
jgi:DNA polymerase-1